MKHVTALALGATLIGAAAVGPAALAHVTLETREAPAGSTYKAVLRVPHGCEGAATTAIRVRIPEGVIAVKPMPKPGWELATTEGRYAQAYELFGETGDCDYPGESGGVVTCEWTPPHSSDGQGNEGVSPTGEPCFEVVILVEWSLTWEGSGPGIGPTSGTLPSAYMASSTCLVVAEIQAVIERHASARGITWSMSTSDGWVHEALS
jgi:hypothetical protein